MKCFRVVLAGSTACLLTHVAGQAADLPSRKSTPVQYVRICDAYGAGFYWIPGTDTCLKVGGRVRVDTWYQPSKNAMVHRSTAGGGIAANTFISSNAVDQNGWLARGNIILDARTQTAWGTVQTVFNLRLQSQSGLANSPPGYISSVFAGGNASTTALEGAAYIRFAGFTIGQAASNFTFMPPLSLHSVSHAGFPTGIRQIAYTAVFGNGISATLALENRAELNTSTNPTTLGANPFTATPATSVSGPQRLPAFVGNVFLDQPWGTAKVSVAVVESTAAFGNPALTVVGNNGPLIRRTGWAVGAGAKINLPMLAAGDNIMFFATYGIGALSYVTNPGINASPGYTGSYLGGFLRADRDMTLFCINAACTVGGSEQTKAYSIAGFFTHYWTPSLRSHVMASYVNVTPGVVSRATSWANGGLGKASVLNLAASLIWSPVRNFDIGVQVSYGRMNQNLPLTVPVGLGTLVAVNPNNWSVYSRVERSF